MRARAVAICALAALAVAAPLACVDLFHSTDFETLHDAGAPADVVSGDAPNDVGPKPLVDFCQWTSEEAKAHAARACAYLGACGGPLGETIFGPCMVHALAAYDCQLNPSLRPNGATNALWSCLSDVKSCGDVQACLGAGATTSCVAVASGSFTQCGTKSDSEVRVECAKPQAGPPAALEPCTLLGKVCEKIDESSSMCAGATSDTCSAGIDCAGSSAVDCRIVGTKTYDFGIDCAAFGAGKCVLDDAGAIAAACAPRASAPDCDGGATVTCDEDGGVPVGIARSCVGGKEIVLDCARLGVACDVTTKPVPAYDPMQACADRVDGGGCNRADTCTAGTLKSCAQGIEFQVDCAAVGLGECEQIDQGVLARCKPL